MLIELSEPIIFENGKHFGVVEHLLRDLLADGEIKPLIEAAIICKNHIKIDRLYKKLEESGLLKKQE